MFKLNKINLLVGIGFLVLGIAIGLLLHKPLYVSLQKIKEQEFTYNPKDQPYYLSEFPVEFMSYDLQGMSADRDLITTGTSVVAFRSEGCSICEEFFYFYDELNLTQNEDVNLMAITLINRSVGTIVNLDEGWLDLPKTSAKWSHFVTNPYDFPESLLYSGLFDATPTVLIVENGIIKDIVVGLRENVLKRILGQL